MEETLIQMSTTGKRKKTMDKTGTMISQNVAGRWIPTKMISIARAGRAMTVISRHQPKAC